ncbi:MAG: amidohydrolase family protein [Pontixanthobacter sp.]
MRLPTILTLSILCVFIPAAANDERQFGFENVKVRTMDEGRIIADGHVIVRDGLIAAVGEGPLPDEYDGERVKGSAEATLMPGLADMHVHYYESDIGAAYLANGITTVRNLTGSVFSDRRDQAARDGTLIGPRVFTSGPIIAGGESFPNDFFVRARSPDQAIGAVRSQARSGYDAVKLYEWLDAETYRAAVTEARANRMKIYSHVPGSMTIGELLDLKIDSIEHLDGFAEVLVKDGFSLSRDDAYAERWANVDTAKFDEWAERTAASGSWMVPTFAITYGRLRSSDPDAYFAQPEAAILPTWAETWRQTALGYETDRPFFDKWLVNKIAFTSALKDAGTNILIGTDGPNPFVTPGYAIHDELNAFVSAGYTTEEVLRIATVEAARFLGKEGKIGVIAVGARADLVLLSADPVTNLDVLRNPEGAMVAGNWWTRLAIDDALDARKKRMKALRVEPDQPSR